MKTLLSILFALTFVLFTQFAANPATAGELNQPQAAATWDAAEMPELLAGLETPRSSVAPMTVRPTVLPDGTVLAQFCCKHCTTGKPCGNSCISRSSTCHRGPGCACASVDIY